MKRMMSRAGKVPAVGASLITGVMLLAACSQGSGASSTTDAAPVPAASTASAAAPAAEAAVGQIAVDIPRNDSDFWTTYADYVPVLAAELGIDLITTNSQNDVQKLVSNAQTVVSQGAKAIVMAPQDTGAIATTLDKLSADGVPVVTIDTRPDKGKVFMVVRSYGGTSRTRRCDR